MKKKFLALALALTLALSLAACGGKDAPAQDGTSDAPEASARRQRPPRPRRRAPRRLTSSPFTTPSGRRTPGRS